MDDLVLSYTEIKIPSSIPEGGNCTVRVKLSGNVEAATRFYFDTFTTKEIFSKTKSSKNIVEEYSEKLQEFYFYKTVNIFRNYFIVLNE